MKRCGLLLVFLGCLASTPVVGGPVKPVPARLKEEVEPFGQRSYVETFKGGQRACVVVMGSGSSYLGLYVYDDQGNCVAWDDLANAASRDSVAVEWFPLQETTCTVQVRNLSGHRNQYKISLR